jgi:2-C-methyl-D-erythritol 2,4-cyclodiphosphate synthase
MRIGQGFDAHQLISLEDYKKRYPNRKQNKLILGGISIDHDFLLAGHSDADVLVHAIIDALLGASGLGDIGELFPDSEKKYSGISSIELLKEVKKLVKEKNLKIANLDATLIAEKPKLSPYKQKIKTRLAEALAINEELINIKATTCEGLGFTGRGEGIAAMATVLLIP